MTAGFSLCTRATAPPHSLRHFILTGYRPLMTEWRDILSSLFYLHNETCNIYTHLVSFIIFSGLAVRHLFWSPYEMTTSDVLVHVLFFSGVLACFGMSSLFHLQACNTLDAYRFYHACDYAGVVACILGSNYIALWVGFRCEPLAQLFYMTLITLQCGPLVYASLSTKYRTNRRLVVSLFVGVVASGVIPTVHWGLNALYSFKRPLLEGIIGMFFFYLVGVVIYVYRIPERFAPGLFDIWGHSHSIWHVFVFLAALMEYLGAQRTTEQAPACL